MSDDILREHVLATLQELGISPATPSTSLDRFYEIGRMRDQVEEKELMIIELTPTKGDRVSIIPVNDIHVGAKASNRKKFEAYLQYILETPDCYTVGLGDLGETATKQSVGKSMFEENMHIPDQLDYLYEKLKPLADAGKLLGLQDGNHEYRVEMMTGLSINRILAQRLGVPHIGYQGYFIFKVGDQKYTVFTHHGKGSGATPGARITGARKFNQVALADLYLSGHTHSKQDDEDILMVIDPVTEQLVPFRRKYVVCGSLMSYWGTYAEMAAFSMVPLGLVRLDFLSNRKEILVHK